MILGVLPPCPQLLLYVIHSSERDLPPPTNSAMQPWWSALEERSSSRALLQGAACRSKAFSTARGSFARLGLRDGEIFDLCHSLAYEFESCIGTVLACFQVGRRAVAECTGA